MQHPSIRVPKIPPTFVITQLPVQAAAGGTPRWQLRLLGEQLRPQRA